MDDNKVRFLHWLNFYNSIYELDKKERPSQDIIDNDVLLDEWVRLYNLKQAKPPKQRAGKQHDDVITFS
jgi:hypothetical protein